MKAACPRENIPFMPVSKWVPKTLISVIAIEVLTVR
jgi:hypothetical protein